MSQSEPEQPNPSDTADLSAENDESAPQKPRKPIKGWRKYIGFGTISLGLLALSSFAAGGIVSPIAFTIGALFLLPGYIRVQQEDGEYIPVSVRACIWVFFFLIGAYFHPLDPDKKDAQMAEAAKQELPTPTPRPTETPKPTPEPQKTTKPTSTPESKKAIANDEPLSNQPMKNWWKATDYERMQAAAFLTYSVFKDKTQDTKLLSLAGQELLACINNVKTDAVDETPVHEIAALCAVGLGWTTE